MRQAQFFGPDGIHGRVGGAVINPGFALRFGFATGRVLAQRHGSGSGRARVLVGKDTRASGYMLESALEAGLVAAGVDVVLTGPLPTPAVAHLTRALRLSAGIVISASHDPYQDNGIKLFGSEGTKLSDATEAVIEAALWEPLGCVSSKYLGRVTRMEDAAGRYVEFCKSTFPPRLDLSGLRIVVDAAHGACYHVVADVFRELGASVHAIGCEPDGFNINAGVGVQYPQGLVETVRTQGADLGIALDGDGDRLHMVDDRGRIYGGDELLYAVVRDRLRLGPVSGVVGTLTTNFGLERRLTELQVPFERTESGDRHILDSLKSRGWLYGGEASGHILCLDRHTTGDGIITALQVIAALHRHQQTLSEWLSDLQLFSQKAVSIPVLDTSWEALDWTRHADLVEARAAVEAEMAGCGRVMIIASGTEAALRLMVEAEDELLAQRYITQLAQAAGYPRSAIEAAA